MEEENRSGFAVAYALFGLYGFGIGVFVGWMMFY